MAFLGLGRFFRALRIEKIHNFGPRSGSQLSHFGPWSLELHFFGPRSQLHFSVGCIDVDGAVSERGREDDFGNLCRWFLRLRGCWLGSCWWGRRVFLGAWACKDRGDVDL
jgi:hypothetical protein